MSGLTIDYQIIQFSTGESTICGDILTPIGKDALFYYTSCGKVIKISNLIRELYIREKTSHDARKEVSRAAYDVSKTHFILVNPLITSTYVHFCILKDEKEYIEKILACVNDDIHIQVNPIWESDGSDRRITIRKKGLAKQVSLIKYDFGGIVIENNWYMLKDFLFYV